MTEDTLEHSARRIAERGREALLSRLRPAFEEAARTHADVLQIEPDQLDDMIQRAADRADGLQWRRALASVATEELGIGLGEALSHPAVERAQEIVGAPSYEESLAQLGVTPAADAAVAPAPDEAATADAHSSETEPAPAEPEMAEAEVPAEPEVAEAEVPAEPIAEEALPEEEPLAEEAVADEAVAEEELAGEYETVAEETNGYDAAAAEDAAGDEESAAAYDAAAPAEPDLPASMRLAAVHLGGIATLEPGEEGLELRIGQPGLDIARNEGRVLGRLRWREIKALEVPPARGLRKRRRQGRSQLVVRTEHGDASFEIPGVAQEELREQLDPLVALYTGRG